MITTASDPITRRCKRRARRHARRNGRAVGYRSDVSVHTFYAPNLG